MFNKRDERVVLSADFYNPYKVGKYVENIKTKQIAEIIDIIENDKEKKVLLQTNIREPKNKETIIEISYKELKENWVKSERIIIKRLPREEERVHLGITFSNTDYFQDEKTLKLKK